MLALTFLELIFRLVMKLPILDWACLRIFLEVNIISLVLSTIFSFCGRILGDILSFVATLIFTIYAIGQAGFENYLGVYVSFGTSSQLTIFTALKSLLLKVSKSTLSVKSGSISIFIFYLLSIFIIN